MRQPVTTASLRVVAVALALIASLTQQAQSQVVTVGTGARINDLPFNGLNVAGYSRYQQVYRAGAFGIPSGPIQITSLTFFSRSPGASYSIDEFGTYLVRLSTTSRAVDGLSATFDANLGSDVQTFFSGKVPFGTLSLAGSTPFSYDPASGNLLLEVFVTGQGNQGYYLDGTAIGAGDVSRVYGKDDGTPGLLSSEGLVTRFAYSRTTISPEPSGQLLLGTGLLGLFGVSAARRRRAPR